jgi:hypothetical protein
MAWQENLAGKVEAAAMAGVSARAMLQEAKHLIEESMK